MKKVFALVLCVILLCTMLSGCDLVQVLLLLFSGGSKAPAVIPQPTAQMTPPTEQVIQPTQDPDLPPVFIRDTYTKKYIPYDFGGFYGESSYDHSITIPALRSGSSDAQAINAEIYGACSAYIEELKNNKEENRIYTVNYQYKYHNGILGLMVSYSIGLQSSEVFSDFKFYYFDNNSGRELTYPEYLSALGMSEETALDSIRAAGIIDQDIYGNWLLKELITDESGTLMLIESDLSMNGTTIAMSEYSILEYPFH